MSLQELETLRQKYAKQVTLGGILVAIGFLFEFIINGLVEENSSFHFIFVVLGIIIIIVGICLIIKASNQFKVVVSTFKRDYVVPIVKEIYPDCTFNPGLGVSEKFATQSGIIPVGDRYHSEDLIEGEFEDVKFTTADVHVEEEHTRTDSDGHTETYYETIFLGRFFEFEFNKNFKHNLIVTESPYSVRTNGMDKVKLESIEFNKKFRTYAQSEHEAFYILTPQIMERLMEIEANNPGNCSFSFYKNKFYFALNNNTDTFTVALYRKIDESMFDQYKNEAKLMKDIINTLKLNIKIFKEEE